MRFDDRLKTVLAQRPRHAHDRVVRWRQLVELLARGGDPHSPLAEQAFAETRSEAAAIDEQLRAATARAIAGRKPPVELVALFAADSISVSAPILAAAKLSEEDWGLVVAEASADSLRFLRSLHPDLVKTPEEEAEPAPEEPAAVEPDVPAEAPQAEEPVAQPEQEKAAEDVQQAQPQAEPHAEPEPAPAPAPAISEVVARIERLRSEREAIAERRGRHPAGPGGEGPALFRWECGPSGEIAWVEGVPRGALIGRSLANPGEHNGVDKKIQRAFAVRAPFREAKLSVHGEGVAAGDWALSGVPAFEPTDGRFAGYRGIGTRAGQEGAAAQPARAAAIDHDSLRELVHELKTPLNAIIGFAEIIDGQYLGPADHSYRERAADIAAQARQLLSAIEDLDLAAQLRSAPRDSGESTDLRDIVGQLSPELIDQARRRGASLLLDLPRDPVRCGVEASLLNRLVRRFCASIIESAGTDERLKLSLSIEADRCQLMLDQPRALGQTEGGTAGADGQSAPSMATVVSLRLVRALARVAGGDLREIGAAATLLLPRSS